MRTGLEQHSNHDVICVWNRPGHCVLHRRLGPLERRLGQDQTVQATIKDQHPNTNCHQEHELILRGSLSPHVATGYEVTVRATDNSSSYLLIAHWNGSLGNFTYLTFLSGSSYGVKTGDVFKATIVGNVITLHQ